MDRGRVVRGLRRVAVVGLVVVVVMQLVPYGWRHPNPPVVADAPWPDARSEALARAACYDCHSNETDWPVYSYVAPMSWLVRLDVERGRDELNFSRWGDDDGEADDAIEQLVDGSMPPSRYVMLHRDADLSEEDERALATALETLDSLADAADDAADGEDAEDDAAEVREDQGDNSGPA